MAPQQALEIVVEAFVEKYRGPTHELINNIKKTLFCQVQKVSTKHFEAYPNLRVGKAKQN